MKVIILAAGQGSRLRPLTNEIPKCMVNYKNKPIIDYIFDVISTCNLDDISIVGGYKFSKLKGHLKNKNIKYYKNEEYLSSNMVHSLFCAKEFFDDDIIISYSDIIYKEEVFKKLIDSKADFNVVVDSLWKDLWTQRMNNPLDDAETLKIKDNKIIELGKKTNNYDEIQGQYIGLIKISKKIISKVIEFYEQLPRNIKYDGKDFEQMYLTSFIQLIIDNLSNVTPVYINGGWLEIDTLSDLNTNIV
jgi:choline kinase